jgi:hypothetical protein
MEKSRVPNEADFYGWNFYVDATMAFLRSDRKSFLQARSDLNRLTKPKGLNAGAEWPQNASVVEGLWRCFGKPYKVAHGSECRRETTRRRTSG